MKQFYTFLILLLSTSVVGQSKIIKLDFENGSFKNFPELPFGESFMIEGEVLPSIQMVEIAVYEAKGNKPLNVYQWSRGELNQSQAFEMMISNPLRSNSKYNFEVSTYRIMTAKEKALLEQELSKRVVYYLKNQISIDGKHISIDDPKKVYKGLNELIDDATYYQRSKNGIDFNGLSELVKDEIANLGDFKLKKLFKKEKGIAKDSLSQHLLDKKLNYLSSIILSEVRPFLSSELVQQKARLDIQSVATEKEPFTLPVNGGLYVWNTTTNANDVSISNTSITPGFGLTLPFNRGLRIKQRSITSLGLSLGVLTTPITDGHGRELATPVVNLPVYGGLGIKAFNFVRLNVGTLIVTETGSDSVSNLEFYPTFGIALELNLWLGIKK